MVHVVTPNFHGRPTGQNSNRGDLLCSHSAVRRSIGHIYIYIYIYTYKYLPKAYWKFLQTEAVLCTLKVLCTFLARSIAPVLRLAKAYTRFRD